MVQGVAHNHLRRERTVPVEAVHDPAFFALAHVGEKVVLYLSPVQVNHLEVPDVNSPVGILSCGHKLQQVPGSALVQETFRRVSRGSGVSLVDALLSIVNRALQLVLGVKWLLFMVRLVVDRGKVLQIVVLIVVAVVVGENVRDADPGSVVLRVEPIWVRRWHLCVI